MDVNAAMIRKPEPADIEELVRLHLRNFDKNELSVILGERFVRLFYTQAVADPQAVLKIVEKQGRIAAVSMYFVDYGRFERAFTKASFFPVLGFFLRSLLSLRLDQLISAGKAAASRKVRHLIDKRIYDFYLGVFIVDQEFRTDHEVVIAFYKALSENVKELEEKSEAGYWGSCRISNRSSCGLLESKKMRRSATVDAFPEAVAVYIKEKA